MNVKSIDDWVKKNLKIKQIVFCIDVSLKMYIWYFLIRYVRHKTALKKSVFVRRVHLELLPLTKTDVRNRTKNLSQRKHGWRNTKRVAPGNIVSLERTGIRLIGRKYVLYIISTTKLCVNITVVRISLK